MLFTTPVWLLRLRAMLAPHASDHLGSTTAVLAWSGGAMKLSCAQNGPVLDKISGIRVLPTGVVLNPSCLAILREHADTGYLVEYWAVWGTR